MNVEQLTCPSCNAPFAVSAGIQTCRYCGATLAVRGGGGGMAPGFREETHYRVVARVGPSNVARIDALLALQGITAAGDRAQGKYEIDVGGDASALAADAANRADRLAGEMRAAGATAEVMSDVRTVPIPLAVRDVDVFLDAVGRNKLAVITAIRAHVDIGVNDARALVGRAPCTVASGMTADKGRALCEALVTAGATARRVPR